MGGSSGDLGEGARAGFTIRLRTTKAAPIIAIAPPMSTPTSGLSPAMLMIVIRAKPRPMIRIPTDKDRDEAAGAAATCRATALEAG